MNRGSTLWFSRDLRTTITSEESKLINFDEKPKVILSASGMCEAGRIRHHLMHNLWRPECTVCFVGYQAVGTLGRKLIEGAGAVKLFGENITVNAKIEVLNGISGHADMNGLIRWLEGFETDLERVIVVHGGGHGYRFFCKPGGRQDRLSGLCALFRRLCGIWRQTRS